MPSLPERDESKPAPSMVASHLKWHLPVARVAMQPCMQLSPNQLRSHHPCIHASMQACRRAGVHRVEIRSMCIMDLHAPCT
mmetsp:Transcript_76707/g.152062  ORF Transcript_76707/g.152062 Transcript_76707/m.152062 type:complete len:81 (+) Transcript_76707:61-303(+)